MGIRGEIRWIKGGYGQNEEEERRCEKTRNIKRKNKRTPMI